jgi:hypothetical protein
MDRVNGSLNTQLTLSGLEVGSTNKLYLFFRQARCNQHSKDISRKEAVEEDKRCKQRRILRKAPSSIVYCTGSERLIKGRVVVGKDGQL